MREARGALPRAPYDRVRLAAQPATAFRASPSSPASVADITTTRRPPPSRGTRMTMPRPSLVTSSGPSPVLGFMAAMRHPLPRRGSCPAHPDGPSGRARSVSATIIAPRVRGRERRRHRGTLPDEPPVPADPGRNLASRRRMRMSSPTDGGAGGGRPPVAVSSEGGVRTIRLDRPEAMNALDLATKVALRDALTTAEADPAVRCVVLTGTGRAFCVGQDLREHVRLLGEGAAAF